MQERDAIMLMRLMTAVTVAVLVGTPVSSNAELVQANLINHGDGLLTRDMATGLDWLDVNLTVNSSYNDMISGAATFASGGFRPRAEKPTTNMTKPRTIRPSASEEPNCED